MGPNLLHGTSYMIADNEYSSFIVIVVQVEIMIDLDRYFCDLYEPSYGHLHGYLCPFVRLFCVNLSSHIHVLS